MELVVLNRDNSIDLELRSNGQPVDISDITRCVVKIVNDDTDDDYTADSEVDDTLFDWSSGGEDGILKLWFGNALLDERGEVPSLLPIGSYTCSVFIYDASNLNGVYWGDFSMRVVNYG